VKLLMRENTKQLQDKGSLRHCAEKSSQQQKVAVVSTNEQTLSYKLAGSSHVGHRITDLPPWWKQEARNAVLEGSRKGAAPAAAKAGGCLRRGYFTSFCKANAESGRISLHKHSQEGRGKRGWC